MSIGAWNRHRSEKQGNAAGSGLTWLAGIVLFRTLLRELAAIFDRLGTTADIWWSRLAKLSKGRLLGRVLAATCVRLQEVANRLGVRSLVNLGRCPAR
jgi:hypothetical protein